MCVGGNSEKKLKLKNIAIILIILFLSISCNNSVTKEKTFDLDKSIKDDYYKIMKWNTIIGFGGFATCGENMYLKNFKNIRKKSNPRDLVFMINDTSSYAFKVFALKELYTKDKKLGIKIINKFLSDTTKIKHNSSCIGILYYETMANESKYILSGKYPIKIETENEKMEIHKIKLDSILTNENDEYYARLRNNTLSFCCYELFDISGTIKYENFNIDKTENYPDEETNEIEIVNVKKYGNSYIKTYYNNHPKVDRIDLVTGKIFDNILIDTTKIKIGISKVKFLNNFFEKSEIYNKIDTVEIVEDELERISTAYIFKNDTLTEINFNSDYDWIKK